MEKYAVQAETPEQVVIGSSLIWEELVEQGVGLLSEEDREKAIKWLNDLMPRIDFHEVPLDEMTRYARAGLGFMLFAANAALKERDAILLAEQASSYDWNELLRGSKA